jgi:hypothetical protein
LTVAVVTVVMMFMAASAGPERNPDDGGDEPRSVANR